MYNDEMTWDTADIKPCPHGFVFLDYCEICRISTVIPPNAADLVLGKPDNGTDG